MTSGPVTVRWVYAALVAYAMGFALFWPRVFLVIDEERYVSQALAFAHGTKTIEGAGILFPPTQVDMISNYPPGTSLLQTPFVWAFGWRGAALLSLIALVAATLVTVRWLGERGRSPAFALLIPGFFAAAFFGRLAMSDLPSTAIVALACLMLWRADRQRLLPSLMAGLLAGVSLLFREPLIVLLAPLLAGALARRRIAAAWLVLGFVLGVGLRAGLSEALFASPLYLRDSGYGFSLSSLRHGIPVYIAILLLMIPGGAVLPFLYRGERRAEIVTAFALYLSVFLFYEYDSIRDNGLAKGLILASRFMVPLAPLLAFMASEVWPRFYASARARVPLGAPHVARLGATIAVAQCFLVHPLAWAQERVPLSITGEVYANTTAAIPVVTNSKAMMKYLSPSYGPRRLILLEQTDADSIPVFARRFGRLGVAILDRNDSEMFRRDTENNARFLAEVDTRCSLRSKHHAQMGWATLRILEITACR